MPLTVGELTAIVSADDSAFDKALSAAGRGLTGLQSTASTATASIEQTVSQAFQRIATEAGSSLDGVPAELGGDADRAAQAVLAAFDGIATDLRADGRKGGEAVADGLEDGLGDTSGIGQHAGEGLGDGIGKGGKGRIGGVISSLKGALVGGPWAAAGAAIGALVIGAVKSAMEREELFAEMSVKVGAFGEEAERLGDIAGDAYADGFGESLDQVTEALTRVYQNIPGASKLGDDALKGTAEQALTTSRVLDEDLGRTTAAVGQMIKTGIADNATEAFDILVKGQQKGVNKSEDLLDTFNEYSTIFRDLGLNGKESLGLLSQGLQAGARDSDVVADALKELDINVKGMSDNSSKALKTLGLAPKKMAEAFAKGGPKAKAALDTILDRLGKVENPAKRSQLAVQLFGTKAEDMARSINSLSLDTATQKIGSFKNSVKGASDTLTNTAQADADKWSRSWGNALSKLGGGVLDTIKAMIPSPADFQEQWNGLTSWLTDTVGPFFSDLWDGVKDGVSTAWEAITGAIKDKSQAAWDWLKELPGKIGSSLSTGWDTIKSTASEKWNAVKTAITNAAQAAWDWLKSLPGKIGSGLASGWDTIKSTASEKWESVKSTIVEKGQAALDWVKKLPGKIKDFFADAGSWLIEAGKDIIRGLINGIKSMASGAVDAAKGVVSDAIAGAKKLLHINSPSKVAAAELGSPISEGIAAGILDGAGAVDSAIGTLVSKAVATGKAALGATLTSQLAGILTQQATKLLGHAPGGLVEPVLSSDLVVPMAGSTPSGTSYNYAGQVIGHADPGGGVTVNIANATVREEADITRLGSAIGVQVYARG